jgi:plastocyanin
MKTLMMLFCITALVAACAGNKPKPRSFTVEINGMKFQPAELELNKGDTVIWVNNDMVAHDITEEKTKSWSSSPLQSGDSWSKVVNESTNYYCSIHVVMKGTLIVH